MFYQWVRQGLYVAALTADRNFVLVGDATLPDDSVLAVSFAAVGPWGAAGDVAGTPWVTHSRARIGALDPIVVGAYPAAGSASVLLMPDLWGSHDGYLACTATSQLLVAVEGATDFTRVPEIEIWHYRPLATAEIVEALPMAEVTAALEATNLYSAIGGAYSDAINRGVQPAPTAGRPAYVVINAPSA